MGAACQSKFDKPIAKLTDIKDKTVAKLKKNKKDAEGAGKDGEKDALVNGVQDTLKESVGDVKNVLGDIDTNKVLGDVMDAGGLKDQLKEAGMTDDKIESATKEASRYIKPEEGADEAKVQKEITENPDVQEFVGQLRAIADNADKDGAAKDAAEKAEKASPEDVKSFMDALKGQFGGIPGMGGAKDGESKPAGASDPKDMAADAQKAQEAAQSGDAKAMAGLVSKYFSVNDVQNLVKNHGDDIQKMVEKQGGVGAIGEKLTGAMGGATPDAKRAVSS